MERRDALSEAIKRIRELREFLYFELHFSVSPARAGEETLAFWEKCCTNELLEIEEGLKVKGFAPWWSRL